MRGTLSANDFGQAAWNRSHLELLSGYYRNTSGEVLPLDECEQHLVPSRRLAHALSPVTAFKARMKMRRKVRRVGGVVWEYGHTVLRSRGAFTVVLGCRIDGKTIRSLFGDDPGRPFRLARSER